MAMDSNISKSNLEDRIKSINIEITDNMNTPSEKQQQVAGSLFNARGFVKYLQVDFPEACKDFDYAISLNPEIPAPYYNRGVINYRMGMFAQALIDLETAVKLDPENREFKIGLNKAKFQVKPEIR